MKKIKQYLKNKNLNILFLATSIMLIYKVLFDFGSVMLWANMILSLIGPFLAGFIIAYGLNIPCVLIENLLLGVKVKWIQKKARLISVVFIYLVLILLLLFIFGTLIPMFYENIVLLITNMPVYFEQALAFFQNHPSYGNIEFDHWIESIIEAKPWNYLLTGFDTSSLLGSFQYVSNFISGATSALLAISSSFCFLLEYNRIKAYIKRLIKTSPSKENRQATTRYIRLIDMSFRKYLRFQLLDALILGVITTIELLILRSPYALVLGLILAIANLVPYYGAIIGFILPVVVVALSSGLETAILAAIILLITQQIDKKIIQSRLRDVAFSISPILVTIGITIGASIGGIVGMFFAVPVVNVIKTIMDEYVQMREKIETA